MPLYWIDLPATLSWSLHQQWLLSRILRLEDASGQVWGLLHINLSGKGCLNRNHGHWCASFVAHMNILPWYQCFAFVWQPAAIHGPDKLLIQADSADSCSRTVSGVWTRSIKSWLPGNIRLVCFPYLDRPCRHGLWYGSYSYAFQERTWTQTWLSDAKLYLRNAMHAVHINAYIW